MISGTITEQRITMIDLDPEKVLKNPWLWDAQTLEWARKALAERQSQSRREKP